MSKKTQYDHYLKASTYLRERYNIFGIGSVSIGKIGSIQKDLIKYHSLDGLKSIRISITAQLEQYKQANILMPILVFIFTVVFTLRYYSYTARREYEKMLDEMSGMDESDTQFEAVNAIDNFLFTNNILLFVIVILMIGGFLLYFQRYAWISLMKSIVDDALAEREKKDKENEKKVGALFIA
ncbi:hypothetical protein B9G55_01565 [Saccharibacillus sp. O16]|nr:hypothetical protein B9G55_01565 [Saccharibacillus sp. O16]